MQEKSKQPYDGDRRWCTWRQDLWAQQCLPLSIVEAQASVLPMASVCGQISISLLSLRRTGR